MMNHTHAPLSQPETRRVYTPLDPGYAPMGPAIRAYRARAAGGAGAVPFDIALERESGTVSRWREPVLPLGDGDPATTCRHVERIIKFLLWARGGGTLHIAGPDFITQYISARYRPDGARAFDLQLMAKVYERPFEVRICTCEDLPPEKEDTADIGGHLDGCRIGFDLGASDYKLAAVKDGEVIYSAEMPWQPVTESDPAYHIGCLNDGLRLAASKLPRVDAIGGSSAGIYLDNKVMVASLFRSISAEAFTREIKPMFQQIQQSWGVPLVVANDGDVTALAGAMSLGKKPLLGIAMGSSEAAGYIDRDGHIRGWLNELAFSPVDLNPEANADEWSGDRGVGALYFSQQAVNRLAPKAGIHLPEDMKLPERLREVQSLVKSGDARAAQIFETIGVYLGYSLLLYKEFYDFNDALILGRVTSGAGGDLIMAQARNTLSRESEASGNPVTLHVPDELNRRVGQAVAAASLPMIKYGKGKAS